MSLLYVKIAGWWFCILTICLLSGFINPNSKIISKIFHKNNQVQILDFITQFVPITDTTRTPPKNTANNTKEIKWVSLDEAFDKARRDNKKILIFVHTDWCGYCKMMQKKAFRNADVVQYMESKYVAVKLNAWSKEVLWFAGFKFRFIDELNIHQLAYQLLDGKMEYPTSVVLNYQYEIIAPIKGYMEAKSLTKALKYYGEDAYLTKSWYEFSNSR